MKARRSSGGARSGAALVEVIVALSILGAAAVGLAGMAFQAGHSATAMEKAASRQSALSNLVDLVVATPFNKLETLAGCEEGGTEGMYYQACVRVSEAREGLMEVTVRIDPDDESVPADSSVVLRALGTASTPF
jgi:hypothetical protein